MSQLTINSSFEQLESAMNAHFQQEKPRKPHQPTSGSSSDFRAHADALDEYEAKLQEYKAAKKGFDEKINEIRQIWRLKLNQEYMPDYPEELASLTYDRAYSAGHSNGYAAVRTELEDLVDFTDKVISFSRK